MKINLLIDNPHGILSDAVNVDPFADGKDSRVAHDLTNLDGICFDGEASEIVCNGLLSYFSQNIIPSILDNWLRKLQYGGRLIIVDFDIEELSQKMLLGDIPLSAFNNMIFGEQKKPWDFKKSSQTLNELVAFFKSRGAKCLRRNYNDNGTFTLIVQRPELQ